MTVVSCQPFSRSACIVKVLEFGVICQYLLLAKQLWLRYQFIFYCEGHIFNINMAFYFIDFNSSIYYSDNNYLPLSNSRVLVNLQYWGFIYNGVPICAMIIIGKKEMK